MIDVSNFSVFFSLSFERETFHHPMSRNSALNLVQWLRRLGGFVDERLAVSLTASGSR
jgi:hypothetical protein